MGLAAFLRKILHSKILLSRSDDGSMVLREKGIMEINVVDTPLDIVGVRFERIGSLAGLRDGKWKKTCDYLLIFEDGDACVAIFIDLKKTIHGDGQPEEQLRWSLPIYRYLCAIYEIHIGHEYNRTGTTVQNFTIGEKYHERFDKQPVRPKPGVVQKETYKGMEVNTYVGPRIPFNSLLRGANDT